MASTKDFVPSREADLVAFNQNFLDQATTMGAAIGLLPAQLTAFETASKEFAQAWEVTRSRSTRSGSAVILKNQKKKASNSLLRQLAGIVQKHPQTTDEQRSLLNLTVPSGRHTRPAPDTAPVGESKGVDGNTAKFRLHRVDTTRRGKPQFVTAAQVYSYVGANPPADPKDWFFAGSTTRTSAVEVPFDASLPMGTKAWVCFAWTNEKGQAGPASAPMQVTLLGGAALPAESLKMAA